MAEGNQGACRRLVDRHLNRLHAAASRMLDDREEAEDVCQEVFLRLWKQAPKWQSGKALLATWLYRVMLNACHDRLRKRRPMVELDFEMASDTAGPERVQLWTQREQLLQQALAELPPRQRQALALCHDAQLSQSDAAAAMEISESALESLLARARRGLQAKLRPVPPDSAPAAPLTHENAP